MAINLATDTALKLLYYLIVIAYLLYFVFVFHRYWLTVAQEKTVDRFQVLSEVYKFMFFSRSSSCGLNTRVRRMEVQLRAMQLILLVLFVGLIAVALTGISSPVTAVIGNWRI